MNVFIVYEKLNEVILKLSYTLVNLKNTKRNLNL